MRQKTQERIETVKENIAQRLEGIKLRSCQARENAINNRINSLTRLTGNMEVKFASISARVQEYYSSTLVPDGKTLSNYDSLLSDISAKKDAVDAALATAKALGEDFSCQADNPKSLFTTFRENMQAVKSALKEYRTSIKNLIVAIRTLNSEENSE